MADPIPYFDLPAQIRSVRKDLDAAGAAVIKANTVLKA